MDNEYEALIEKKVWEVVLPPPNTNIVGSHWTLGDTRVHSLHSFLVELFDEVLGRLQAQ